ncbi:MAG: hypothetical protein CEN91_1, partial [Candidatus Berkelbacteria bacterium Licking1014_85]
MNDWNTTPAADTTAPADDTCGRLHRDHRASESAKLNTTGPARPNLFFLEGNSILLHTFTNVYIQLRAIISGINITVPADVMIGNAPKVQKAIIG